MVFGGGQGQFVAPEIFTRVLKQLLYWKELTIVFLTFVEEEIVVWGIWDFIDALQVVWLFTFVCPVEMCILYLKPSLAVLQYSRAT